MAVVPLVRSVGVLRRRRVQSRLLWNACRLVSRLAGLIAREVRVRRDTRRLAEFSDYMLHDIGITRADLEGAVRRGRDEAPPRPSVKETPESQAPTSSHLPQAAE